MKRALALLGLAALLLAARPGTEFNMLTALNGQEVAWTLPDGGQSLMSGSGIQCMDVRGLPAAANSVVEIVPLNPINLCYVNINATPAWDGGCGTAVTDVNYGVPLQAFIPKYALLKSTTTHLCQVSDAGTATTAVFSMQ